MRKMFRMRRLVTHGRTSIPTDYIVAAEDSLRVPDGWDDDGLASWKTAIAQISTQLVSWRRALESHP